VPRRRCCSSIAGNVISRSSPPGVVASQRRCYRWKCLWGSSTLSWTSKFRLFRGDLDGSCPCSLATLARLPVQRCYQTAPHSVCLAVSVEGFQNFAMQPLAHPRARRVCATPRPAGTDGSSPQGQARSKRASSSPSSLSSLSSLSLPALASRDESEAREASCERHGEPAVATFIRIHTRDARLGRPPPRSRVAPGAGAHSTSFAGSVRHLDVLMTPSHRGLAEWLLWDRKPPSAPFSVGRAM
jgi:hypothetical protein